MKLFFRESGMGRPMIILHGLFGSSDNWFTLAKTFAETHHVYLIDQRNHGQSPHSDEFNYKILTDDLYEFVKEHQIIDPIIIGHSMGGKTAMNFAVKYPSLVQTLIVVDIVPKTYPIHHDRILEGMDSIPTEKLQTRIEADEILSKFVAYPETRQFLLKNLLRKPGGVGFQWKINLPAIDKHIEEIGQGMQYEGSYAGPTIFIMGERSDYFQPGDEAIISKVFPRAKIVTLDTSHWVQAEKPAEFAATVLEFLKPE
jgi:esterase